MIGVLILACLVVAGWAAVGIVVLRLAATPAMPHPEQLPVRYTHAAPTPVPAESWERSEAEEWADGHRRIRHERWELRDTRP